MDFSSLKDQAMNPVVSPATITWYEQRAIINFINCISYVCYHAREVFSNPEYEYAISFFILILLLIPFFAKS